MLCFRTKKKPDNQSFTLRSNNFATRYCQAIDSRIGGRWNHIGTCTGKFLFRDNPVRNRPNVHNADCGVAPVCVRHRFCTNSHGNDNERNITRRCTRISCGWPCHECRNPDNCMENPGQTGNFYLSPCCCRNSFDIRNTFGRYFQHWSILFDAPHTRIDSRMAPGSKRHNSYHHARSNLYQTQRATSP